MTMGLRRFAQTSTTPAAVTGAGVAAHPGGCELCGQPMAEQHGHLVDLHQRSLVCACPACYLLFSPDASSAGRYRAIGKRYRHRPQTTLSDPVWHQLGVPVGLAFCFYNSSLEQPVVIYPSPAGATEAELSATVWQELTATEPLLAELHPDVEAMLVNRIADPAGSRYESFLVPIDACYHLVGLVRRHWRGFDGGQEAWQEINGFLTELRQRAQQTGELDG